MRLTSIKRANKEQFVYDPACEAPHAYLSNGFVSHNCVLWIDEIEKGLSGTKSSGTTDGGTTSRVFSTLIHWMQDKKKPVFVIATANDVQALPPELLRKGRIDEIFFVDLPTENERAEIWRTHIARAGRDPKKFNITKLAKKRHQSDGGKYFDFSGSEIEEALNDTLFKVFSARPKAVKNGKQDINDKDILETLTTCIPISLTFERKVKKIQDWGRKHARFASSKVEETTREKHGQAGASQEKQDQDDLNILCDA